MIGDPLPGRFYLVSNPQFAPLALTLRVEEAGGPGRRRAEFDTGEEVVVSWSTLPLPRDKWIEVNGEDCDGTFEIRERFQTELLLVLAADGSCRVEVRGIHPEGNAQDLPTE